MTLHRGKLTARYVETAAPGTHDDGRGLRLIVRPSGARSWILRYQLDHRRRDMGLGRYPETTLAMARARALEIRREIDVTRRDPLAERRRAKGLAFKDAAEALIESKRDGWRNAKHRQQGTNTLATYIYPTRGDRDVRTIDTLDVLAVLRPIWSAKPEAASRVRQRVEAVLDYAAAIGACPRGDNPARWRGHLDHLLPKPGKVRAVEHHAALDWRQAPVLMAELAKREGVAAKALAFAIHTAARSGEVHGMRWGEVDRDGDAAVWTVPAERMKGGKEHRVPLPPAALALLGDRGGADHDALVFPSPGGPAKPLLDMTLTAVLKRMDREDITAHGFRSTFRDWAGETTTHPKEVIETALAHKLEDKAEAAYARGDLMQDWADFLAKPTADVVELPAGPMAARA